MNFLMPPDSTVVGLLINATAVAPEPVPVPVSVMVITGAVYPLPAESTRIPVITPPTGIGVAEAPDPVPKAS